MTILNTILEHKAREVAILKDSHDRPELRRRAMDLPSGRDLVQAIRSCPAVPIIAEIKRVSPSQGKLRDLPDPAAMARTYAAAAAVAVSVLTDGPYFGGSLKDLTDVRHAVDLPLLRKDFIIDAIQLYEAKLAGADAVLLIVAALKEALLKDLFREAVDLGMTPVVEVHNEEEMDRGLALDPPVIGINNRNLATLEVSLETTVNLAPDVPDNVVVLAESGIKTPRDIARLRSAGADAFLVGTTLMASHDPSEALGWLGGKCLRGDPFLQEGASPDPSTKNSQYLCGSRRSPRGALRHGR